jgi:hypothetical protein
VGGTLDLLVRLVISMAVVMAVMAGAAHLVRRRQGLSGGLTAAKAGRPGGRHAGAASRARRGRPEPACEIVFRRPLSKGASIAVVQAGGSQYLLGVTDRSVNLLAEVPLAAPAGTDGAEAPLATLTALPARRTGTDNWDGTGRTPAPMAAPEGDGLPATAWKLAIDSLRERTVRR